jgi:hypothetical protein
MRRLRRLTVFLCIVAVLASVWLAPAAGGSVPAVLVPLDPLFGLVVLPAAPADDPTPAYGYVPTGPTPSRAPPALA